MDLVRNIRPRTTKSGECFDVRLSIPGYGRQYKGGFATRVEAAAWRDKVEASLDAEALLRKEALRLPKLVDLWIEGTAKDKQGSTLVAQRSAASVHLSKLDMPIDHVSASVIESYIEKLGHSTAKRVVDMIKAALRWAARPDIRLIDSNPLRDVPVRLPRKSASRRAVSVNHFMSIVEAETVPARKLLWIVLGYTGMRRGEATALRWEDIDWSEPLIRVRRIATPESKGRIVEDGRVKMGQMRDVPMSDEVAEALLEAWRIAGKPRTGFIFPSDRKTGPIGFTATWRWWQTATERVDLPEGYYTIHGLRHMFVTLLIDNGEDIKTVSEIVGHSNAKTTQDVYWHVNASHKRKSIAKLGKLMKGTGQ